MSAGTLAIITNDPHEVFQRAVISGIREVAERDHYAVIVHSFGGDPARSSLIPASLTDLDGLLVIANILSDDTLRGLYKQGKPIALVSHRVPDTAIPVVVSNNQQGMAELVYHLVNRCQRRDMVFIRGLMDQTDAQERELAFRQELIRYHLRVPSVHYLQGDFSPAIAAKSVQAALQLGLHFDSIVASDYVMAIAAVDVLRQTGVAVPGDVSVVGFGDSQEAEAAGLTTVAANIVELGACAARQLISQIQGLRISGVTMLSVRLMIRQTCGYRPSASND
ncbi:MAG TPA: substrate-binding domain-containing protein [Aggregatilineales bacterium]|nr:substrate-binding domain-containing protein [Aggregatilineales bacterium]